VSQPSGAHIPYAHMAHQKISFPNILCFPDGSHRPFPSSATAAAAAARRFRWFDHTHLELLLELINDEVIAIHLELQASEDLGAPLDAAIYTRCLISEVRA
jgi:hypothetical protein